MKKHKLWVRALSVIMSAVMMTSTVSTSVGAAGGRTSEYMENADVSAQNDAATEVTGTENASSTNSDAVNTVKQLRVSGDSKLTDISQANTISFNADGEAVLSQSDSMTASVEDTPEVMSLSENDSADTQNQEAETDNTDSTSSTSSTSTPDNQVPLMNGDSVDVDLSENEDGSVDIAPNLDDSKLVYNEDDAAVVADNPAAEYIGSNEGTDLATYQITPQDDAIYYDSVIDQSTQDMLSEYWNEGYMDDAQIQEMITAADTYEAEIAAIRDTPEHQAMLETSTDSELVHKEVVAGAGGAEENILVVDDTIVCVYVKDKYGDPINGATVTSKLDNQSPQNAETHSVGQDLKGIAVLKNLAGIHNGSLNISMPNYQVKTMMTTTFVGGSVIEVRLEPDTGETYIRGAQIGYADAVNDTAKIELCQAPDKYKITVLLANKAATGSFPTQLTLRAKEKGTEKKRDLMTVNAAWHSSGPFTYQYDFVDAWSNYFEEGDEILKIGDSLEVWDKSVDKWYGDLSAKIERAIVDKPVYSDLSFSIAGLAGEVKLPDGIPGVGGDKISLDFLKCKFDLLICLDGTLSLSYKADIKKIVDKNSFVTSNYTPGIEKKASTIFESIENAFNKKMDLFMNGKGMLYDTEDRGFDWDPSAHLKVGQTFCMSGKYDSATGYLRGSLKAMITVKGDFGITFYAVIPPSVYAGFQVSLGASVGGNLGVKFKPTDILRSIAMDEKGANGILLGIDIGLMVYLGVGMRGVLCVEAQGSVGLGVSVDFRANSKKPDNNNYPRVLVKGQYEVALEATVLWITYHHTFLGDKTTFVDTWGLEKFAQEQAAENTKTYEIVFDNTTMEATLGEEASVATGAAAEVTLDSAMNGEMTAVNEKQDGADGYVSQQSKTDGVSLDSKLSYVDVKGVTYLFRMVQVKYYYTYPTLVYQKELKDGSFENTIHLVPYNGKEYYDYEFDVFSHSGDDKPYVYIGLISGDRGAFENVDDYAEQTSSRVVIMNLAENTIIRNERLQGHSDKLGKYYKFQPSIYGYHGNFAMEWQCRPEVDTEKHPEQTIYNVRAINENALDTNTKTKDFWKETYKMSTGCVSNYCVGIMGMVEVTKDNIVSYWIQNNADGENSYLKVSHFNRPGTFLMADTAIGKGNTFTNGQYNYDTRKYEYTTQEGYLKMVNFFPSSKAPSGIFKNYEGILKDRNGKPFVLPHGASIYQRCTYYPPSGGKWQKLVAVVNGAEGSQFYIYNIDMNDIVHGPRIVELKGQTICQMDTTFSNYGELRVTYTANKKTSVVTDVTDLDQGWGDAKITDACTLYLYQEPDITSAKLDKLLLETSLVKKTNLVQSGKVVIENNGTTLLQDVSYTVSDQYGNVLVDKAVHGMNLYPGETVVDEFTFAPRKDWEAGSEIVLTAKTSYENGTSLEDDTEIPGAGCEEGEEAVVRFDQSALQLTGEDCIVGDEHVAALTMSNDSAIASGASTITVYKNTIDGDKSSVYTTVNVGSMEDTYLATNNLQAGMKYNINIPLQTCWEDPACLGVTIELNGEKESDNGVSAITIANPLRPNKMTISTYPNDITYGVTWGDGNYEEGTTVTLGAAANGGYQFQNWTDAAGNVISNSAEFDYTVPGDSQSLYANFAEDGAVHKVVVDAETYLATAEEAQNQSVLCEAGEAEDGSMLYEIEEGKVSLYGADLGANLLQRSYMVPSDGECTISAEAVQGYVFDRWIEIDEEGNELATISWDAEYTFTPDHEMFVRALFTDSNSLHIVSFDARRGTCETAASLTWEDGTLREISEAEKKGFDFLGWFTEDEAGTQIGAETVFTEDTTVYAHYAPQADATFTITTSSSEGGSVDPAGEQKVGAGADLTVNAKADKGYHFDGWEVDGLADPVTDVAYTFTYVEEEHTIQALFARDADPTPTPTGTPTPTVTPTGTPTPTATPTVKPTSKPTSVPTGKPVTTGSGTNSGTKTNNVKTGDTNNLVRWILMCVFAAGVFGGIGFVYVSKRKKKDGSAAEKE